MGIDSSDYRFKESEDLETILRVASNAYSTTDKPKLRLTIRSTGKQQIQRIVKDLDFDFINYGLQFKAKQLDLVRSELMKHSNDFRSLSISIPTSIKESSGMIRLNYHQIQKDSTAYIRLASESKNGAVKSLSKFLQSINEYSEFGPEDEDEIFQFTETIYNLNELMRSQDKWKFETGCIDFEPINDRTNKISKKRPKSISGLKVQFSKIHAMAYKAKGIIDLSQILIENNCITTAEYHVNSENKSTISIIDDIQLEDVSSYFYYTLDSVDSIKELEWVLQNNECTIELCDCKFSEDDEFDFSLYIAGNSIENLDVDLFIDYQSPEKYKNKVLNLFEGKMKHVGDG